MSHLLLHCTRYGRERQTMIEDLPAHTCRDWGNWGDSRRLQLLLGGGIRGEEPLRNATLSKIDKRVKRFLEKIEETRMDTGERSLLDHVDTKPEHSLLQALEWERQTREDELEWDKDQSL